MGGLARQTRKQRRILGGGQGGLPTAHVGNRKVGFDGRSGTRNRLQQRLCELSCLRAHLARQAAEEWLRVQQVNSTQTSEPVCPDCGFKSPPGFRFCGGCGVRLADAPLPDSGQALERARAGGPERRQLTVMFCDLVDSTAMSQRLELEDLRDVMRAFQDHCTAIVHEHGGMVSRYMGDALLVLFGYPKASEDDAERAVRAGLQMTAEVRDLESPRRLDQAIAVRVGIATGLVVVGDWIGEGPSLEQAVLGEAPNLAARLQALAPPHSVVISEATRALIGGRFVCENLGLQSLKGFDAPVAAWRVSAVGAATNRFPAMLDALTPLVDREDERAWLGRLWADVVACHGKVALIGGEAGIGKSRLVAALREQIGEAEHAYLGLQCSPYFTNRALHPVIQYIEAAASLDMEDAAATKVARLSTWLGAAANDELAIPLLCELLSIADERPPLPPMTPSRQKELTFELLLSLLHGMALARPLLLVCEDAHWIDPTSDEFLGRLVARIGTMPVLAVFTHRPQSSPSWPGVERRTLQRLDDEQARLLVERVAGTRELPPGVLRDLVGASDGIPLFIEEVTRATLQEGAAGAAASRPARRRGLARSPVPPTLHDALQARLDQLGPERQVAQLASVIGREFSYPLLQALSPLPPHELLQGIEALKHAGLVQAGGSAGGMLYRFNHALVREAAYETLLRDRRRELHALTAEVLERQFPHTARDAPELVAHHWTEAARPEPAWASWFMAGQRANARSEHREAIGHLQLALALLPQLADSTARAERELEVLIELAPALIVTQGAGTAQVNGVYERALQLGAELPTSALNFAAHWGWWRVSMDHRSGRGRADELIVLAQGLADPGLLVQAHHAQWATLYHLGAHEACCRHAEQGVRLYDPQAHRSHGGTYGGHDPKVCALGESALSAWLLGRVDEARAHVVDALAWAETLQHAGSRVHAMDYALQFHRLLGDAPEVARRADELVAYAIEQHLDEHRAKGMIFKGWAQACLEPDAEQAFRVIGAALAAEKSAATPEDFPVYYEMFADVCARARHVDEGLSAVDEALELADKGGFVYWNAELFRRRAELLIVSGAAVQAIDASFAQALACAREQGALSLELRAALSRARFLKDSADAESARLELEQVLARFDQGLTSADVVAAQRFVDERR